MSTCFQRRPIPSCRMIRPIYFLRRHSETWIVPILSFWHVTIIRFGVIMASQTVMLWCTLHPAPGKEAEASSVMAPLRAQTGRLIMPDSGGSPRPGRKSPRGGEDVPTVRSLREDRSSRHRHCLPSPREVSILHVFRREPVKQMLGISKLLAQWWLTSFPT